MLFWYLGFLGGWRLDMGRPILQWALIGAVFAFCGQFGAVTALEERPGCPESDFLSCVTRLRLRRVPFDKNMLNVVFNVTTEAKLQHTCMSYSDIIPCFRDRILRCGNDKQRRMLDEVTKMVRFLCSPTSKEKQTIFLKHVQCIGRLLQMPVSADCALESHREYHRIVACRAECNLKRDFLCMLRVWVSEQSLCTLIDIERTCGLEAANFYEELQRNVFSDEFPIVCSTNSSTPSSGSPSGGPSEVPTFPTFTPQATTSAGLGGHSRLMHTVPEPGLLYTVPEDQTTKAVSTTSVAPPWWVTPTPTAIHGSHGVATVHYVHRPDTTTMAPHSTSTMGPTSTSLWQKWLQYILPTSTMAPASMPAPTVATTTASTPSLLNRRRLELTTIVPTTWRPWYLGGVVEAPKPEKQKQELKQLDMAGYDSVGPLDDSGDLPLPKRIDFRSSAWRFTCDSVVFVSCVAFLIFFK